MIENPFEKEKPLKKERNLKEMGDIKLYKKAEKFMKKF